MDSHPETDLDAAMSNPEEAEDRTAVSQQHHPHPDQPQQQPPRRFESEEEEEEDDEEELDEEEEDEVSGMSQLHVSGGPDPTEEMILAQLRQEQERKLLERELLAQKELMIKREEYLPSPGRPGSKSPSSPPGTQYLYAAGHPFAAAAAAAFLTPAHMAAAAAAAQAAAAAASNPAQQQQPRSMSSSSTGSATPPVNGIGLSSPRAGDPDQSKYTYEEQFKQLYELSDDPRRKSFLDDLFSYMQKRGTPVTRIPIMAKQVLDLYELYRLVVARGGLVEVINKKIWREITKGLNLPSSITSAAFTLRTQYMKYLYAYECDKEKLSSAEELQAAIDGNRREGRRSSYGTYADVVPGRSHPPPLNSPLSLVSRHMNGHGSNPGGRGASSPLQLAYYPPHSSAPLNLASSHENGIYGNHALSSGFVQFGVVPPPESYSNSTKDFSKVPSPDYDQNNSPKDLSKDSSYKNGRRSSEDDNCNSVPSTPNPLAMPQEQALNLEVSRNSSTNNGGADHKPPLGLLRDQDSHHHNSSSKRPKIEEDRLSRSGMPSTHIKITSNRGPDGRTQSDGSLMVSMEVNGILYQGVLLAAPNHRNRL